MPPLPLLLLASPWLFLRSTQHRGSSWGPLSSREGLLLLLPLLLLLLLLAGPLTTVADVRL